MNKKEVMEKDEIKEIHEKRKRVPKEISQEIAKKIFKNIIKAIFVIVYFMILNLAYVKIQETRLLEDLKVFAGMFLVVGLINLEYAYKKDSGTIAISGIELLFLSMHTLSITHICVFLKYDFRFYLLTSSYIFAIYYVLKSIVIYTKERKKYLENLSDISDIVKKEKPIIKEAKKRNEKVVENKEAVSNNTKPKVARKTKNKTLENSKKEENTKKRKTAKSTTTKAKTGDTEKNKKATTKSKTKTTKPSTVKSETESKEEPKKTTTKRKTKETKETKTTTTKRKNKDADEIKVTTEKEKNESTENKSTRKKTVTKKTGDREEKPKTTRKTKSKKEVCIDD